MPINAPETRMLPENTVVSLEPQFAKLQDSRPGASVQHEFTLYNGSKNPILIESVKPSCSCISLHTVSGDPDSVVLPGTYVKISAEMEMPSNVQRTLGKIQLQYIDQVTRVQRQMFTEFSVSSELDFELEPNHVDFGEVATGQECSASVVLKNTLPDVDVHLVSVESSSPDIPPS